MTSLWKPSIGTLQLNINVVQTFWLLQPIAFLMFPPSSPSSLLKLPVCNFHIRHTNQFVPQTFGKRLVFSFSRDVYYSQEKLETINMQIFLGTTNCTIGNVKVENYVREKQSHSQFYFSRAIPSVTATKTSPYRRFNVLIKMCINEHPCHCHVHWYHQFLDTGRPSLIFYLPNHSFIKLKCSLNKSIRHWLNVIGNNLPHYVVFDDITSAVVTKIK